MESRHAATTQKKHKHRATTLLPPPLPPYHTSREWRRPGEAGRRYCDVIGAQTNWSLEPESYSGRGKEKHNEMFTMFKRPTFISYAGKGILDGRGKETLHHRTDMRDQCSLI